MEVVVVGVGGGGEVVVVVVVVDWDSEVAVERDRLARVTDGEVWARASRDGAGRARRRVVGRNMVAVWVVVMWCWCRAARILRAPTNGWNRFPIRRCSCENRRGAAE